MVVPAETMLVAGGVLIVAPLLGSRKLPPASAVVRGGALALATGLASVVGLEGWGFYRDLGSWLAVVVWGMLWFGLWLSGWAWRSRASAPALIGAGISFAFAYVAGFSIGPFVQGLAWLQLALATSLAWPALGARCLAWWLLAAAGAWLTLRVFW